jgi:ubiquinone/menaquinone biosynthesis C-methylase UbiE
MVLSAKTEGYQTSWYDGWFFATLVDPMSEGALHLNRRIGAFIQGNTTVLDIGCGTGSLAVSLSGQCISIVGIDISPRMLDYAKKHNTAFNVTYMLTDKTSPLSSLFSQKFDYAILKMVLHEMPEAERKKLLYEAQTVSGELIIAEWIFPQPASMNGLMTWAIEWMAPKKHFAHFRHWQLLGGIDGFLKRYDCKTAQEELFNNKTGKIVCVSGSCS